MAFACSARVRILSLGDFELALRGLLGDGAPLSPSSILRLKQDWQRQYDAWKRRDLAELELVYLWADGIYVKAGLEDSKAALLVLIGAKADGEKIVLAVESGQRESTESWSGVLRDLRARGLVAPRLTMADGHLGIWGALRTVYPQERRAEVLESQDEKRAGCGTAEAPGGGEGISATDRSG